MRVVYLLFRGSKGISDGSTITALAPSGALAVVTFVVSETPRFSGRGP